MATDLNTLLNDPEFHALPITMQFKILRENYPDFNQLPGSDQGKLLNEFSAKVRPIGVGENSKSETPGFVGTMWNAITGIPGAVADAVHNYSGPGGFIDKMTDAGLELHRKAMAEPGLAGKIGYHVASAVPLLGPQMAQAGEDFGEGNIGGGIANTLLATPPLMRAAGSGIGKVAGKVPLARTSAAISGGLKAATELPTVTKAGDVHGMHMSLLERSIKGARGAGQAWEQHGSQFPPVETSAGRFAKPAPVQYGSSPFTHPEYAIPDVPVELPPGGNFPSGYNIRRMLPNRPIPAEQPMGGWPNVQHAGPDVPRIEFMPPPGSPMQWAGPEGPGPVEPHPAPAYPTQWGYGGPGPRETPPGGSWGKGYRATKAPGPGPVEGPEGGAWPKGYQPVQAPQQAPQMLPQTQTPQTQIPPQAPMAGGGGGGIEPVRTDNMQIPNRYQTRNNPSAAHNVDKRIAQELKAQGVSGDKITPQHIENAKMKLGHLRATPKLADIQATMREMGLFR